ncbi:MAG: aminopeptidase [Caldilineales bacterium]|nr:aminopeptidase [Caldilineales bacterium]
MTNDFEQKLERYAELAVTIGANIQPGQKLIIWRATLDTAPLVRLIAAKAYEAGARLVDVMWTDEGVKLARFQYAPRDSFEEYPDWQAQGMYDHVKSGGALISVRGDDPDLLKDQDGELAALTQKIAWQKLRPTLDFVGADAINWLVIGAATPAWAAKVYPELPVEEAVSSLWENLFDVCRVTETDPVAAWQAHKLNLAKRSEYLNAKAYNALRFQGSGTDLTLGLPAGHIWLGGAKDSQNGIEFVPNMPTEEVFTAPHRYKAEGVARASLPLSYGGSLIEDFTLTFHEGRVVDLKASKAEKVLKGLVESDDGAGRLGEVALAPHSSRVASQGRLFFNTLLDENAASHIALGSAYRVSLIDGEAMTDEEFNEFGCNTSAVHVDFMIGSGEMDVDGITQDGRAEAVMRRGEWVFDV